MGFSRQEYWSGVPYISTYISKTHHIFCDWSLHLFFLIFTDLISKNSILCMFLLKLYLMFRFNFKNIQFIILSPYPWIWSIQFSSVTQSCLTATAWLQHTRLPSPSPIPGPYSNSCPVHHQFPELTRTHVHCISDAIQPSHPLSPPSPPAFNLSQHQRLFQLVSSSTIR